MKNVLISSHFRHKEIEEKQILVDCQIPRSQLHFFRFCICLVAINHRAKLLAKLVHRSSEIQSAYSEPPPYLTLTHQANIPLNHPGPSIRRVGQVYWNYSHQSVLSCLPTLPCFPCRNPNEGSGFHVPLAFSTFDQTWGFPLWPHF